LRYRESVLAHEFAEVNGVRLHYATAGRGPLILFLHGFPEFWYAWRKQLGEFARDHQAAAPDMRGYNLSGKPPAVEEYRMSRLVEDVRALAAHLGHRRFTLVGHDWGGAVAWAFALRHPESLDRLVIVNAPHPAVFLRELAENPAQQRASRYMHLFRSPEAEAALSANDYAALVEMVIRPGLEAGYFTDTDRAAYLAAWSQPGALTGGLNYYRAMEAGTPRPAGPGMSEPIAVPTLVVWGEADRALLTGNLVGLEALVRDLTVRRIPDGTHWIVHEQPELVNGAIREFLGRR
jgi:pimeloyl-ACP methyl ester carboxylesterase